MFCSYSCEHKRSEFVTECTAIAMSREKLNNSVIMHTIWKQMMQWCAHYVKNGMDPDWALKPLTCSRNWK